MERSLRNVMEWSAIRIRPMTYDIFSRLDRLTV